MVWFKRTLRFLLAVVLLAALVAGVYVWRASPKLQGSLQVPGIGSEVQIKRDASDVTHIEAASERDAAFAQGWVHAQERGWQLEFNRRIMHGELSSFLGKPTLETDKLMRTLGIVQAAQQQFNGLTPEVRDHLQAYADGINAFHAGAGQALPPEFHILGIKPGLWTPQDSVGWSIMMALDLGGNWGSEIARLSAARVLSTDRLWQMYPVYEGEKPAATADLAKVYRDLGVYAAAKPVAPKTAQADQNATINVANNAHDRSTNGQNDSQNTVLKGLLSNPSAQQLAAWAADLGTGDAAVEGKGSNNWVLGASRSASGKPMLANDPHLGLSSPAIWYFARLKAPGLDAIGATLPGLPGVILGRNARVAWGFTNVGPDVQDVYIERVNPANPAQYQTPDGFANFSVRQESIAVKGQGNEVITVRGTRHGPVLSDSLKNYNWINTSTFALSLRFSALDADNRTVAVGFKASKAKSVAELVEAYRDYHSPMQNVVMADVQGATAYQAVGKAPLRKPGNDIMGLAPSPGWDAKYDWDGWIAYDQNPRVNSAAIEAKGWHATANQKILPAGYSGFMGQDWAAPYRFDRIEALLGATQKHDAASVAKVHGDVKSLATVRLLPQFRLAVQSSTLPDLIKTSAATWDGTMAADSALPLVFTAWMDQLARDLLPAKLGEERFKAQYGRRQFRQGLEHALEKNDLFWCGAAGCPAASAQAMANAVARLQGAYGTDVNAWNWGRAHLALSRHNPLGNVAALSKVFDVKEPTGGDGYTVNVGQPDLSKLDAPFANRHAASLRAIYDLSDLEKSQFIYQTGQSGLVWSTRYRNMSSTWAQVGYRPLQLKPNSFASQLLLTP